MSRLSFDTSEALIYDPVPMNRNATRTTLYALGFKQIDSVGSMEAFRSRIRKRPPDLVLCEAQPDSEVCDAVRSLRHGTAGYNPFIVVIVTAWDSIDSLVQRVLDCGADDLLLRPFSTAMLESRIKTHVERRKGFIVTTEYVGPDRRREANRSSSVDLFDPPNSLQMKARDHLAPEIVAQRLDLELKVALDILHSEKLRRDSFQICVLWRLLQLQTPGTIGPEAAKLRDLTHSVENRCRELEISHTADWCQSILAGLDGINAGVDRSASLHLLGHAALSLNQLFSPEKSTGEHLAEIDAAVAVIRARDVAMAS
ncbi:MAG TPA: response regulator [Rhizomicrobium sp.]|jgi:DNA-binding response OmpR family regulator